MTEQEKVATETAEAEAPKVEFNLESWKRLYCNSEITESIPWFFEHFDSEHFTIWFSKYNTPVEMPQRFMVNNLVGGTIQRLDSLSRNGFGSILIFGEQSPYEIEALWVFTGHELPKEFTDCADTECYDTRKMDLNNEADKVIIKEFLAWEGDFGGRKNPDGRLFK
ncbi:hypothetical protein EIN_469660 [Entamoeba invadens IP1]|uniref:EF-1-gamma C-terminal domain-containing protein n=1 Tax=Entamoeba invadens IP1 TaxID=370355 RepID=A0A0A1TUK6_ENTIV|nr:hypothetical protein EIN_469660 [Entamoeba invadens IP1]ELP83752.1 hypothetical protein EIN_469660 [Entamoeba invadens IP1]|eukprot:XP_004183098.1 hypothetical protein EIN_469660 [Entamoeba invadens IP1]